MRRSKEECMAHLSETFYDQFWVGMWVSARVSTMDGTVRLLRGRIKRETPEESDFDYVVTLTGANNDSIYLEKRALFPDWTHIGTLSSVVHKLAVDEGLEYALMEKEENTVHLEYLKGVTKEEVGSVYPDKTDKVWKIKASYRPADGAAEVTFDKSHTYPLQVVTSFVEWCNSL